jgi:hypothetical protein
MAASMGAMNQERTMGRIPVCGHCLFMLVDRSVIGFSDPLPILNIKTWKSPSQQARKHTRAFVWGKDGWVVAHPVDRVHALVRPGKADDPAFWWCYMVDE